LRGKEYRAEGGGKGFHSVAAYMPEKRISNLLHDLGKKKEPGRIHLIIEGKGEGIREGKMPFIKNQRTSERDAGG